MTRDSEPHLVSKPCTCETCDTCTFYARRSSPRAYFRTRQEAFDAATSINDHFKAYLASYWKLHDTCWAVEVEGDHLPRDKFIKRLAAAGFEGSIFPLKK